MIEKIYTSNQYLFNALFIFLLGVLLSYLNYKLRIFREIRKIQDFVIQWVRLIEPQIVKQVKSIDLFTTKMRNDEINEFIQINIHSDKLKEISSKEKLNTFITNKKNNISELSRVYFTLENQIELLFRKTTNITTYLDYCRVEFAQLSKDWEIYINNFNGDMQKFISILRPQPNLNVYYKELVTVINENRSKYGKIPSIYEELIKPLIEIIDKVYIHFNEDELFFNISERLRMLKVTKDKYINARDSAIFILENYSKDLSEGYSNLRQASEKMGEYKFKFLLFLR